MWIDMEVRTSLVASILAIRLFAYDIIIKGKSFFTSFSESRELRRRVFQNETQMCVPDRSFRSQYLASIMNPARLNRISQTVRLRRKV